MFLWRTKKHFALRTIDFELMHLYTKYILPENERLTHLQKGEKFQMDFVKATLRYKNKQQHKHRR